MNELVDVCGQMAAFFQGLGDTEEDKALLEQRLQRSKRHLVVLQDCMK